MKKLIRDQSIKAFYGLDKLLVLTQKNKAFFQLFEIKFENILNDSNATKIFQCKFEFF